MSYVLTVGLNPALQKVLTFPRLTIDGVNRASTAASLASGKGINVARTLGLLGHRVVATGLLGGPSGVAIEAELKREGIPSAFTAITAPTRICVTIEERERQTTTELIEPSPPVGDGELERWRHAYESLVPWTRFVVISGTVPEKTPASLYRKLVALARRHQKPSLVDCGGELWREAAAAEPDVLKANEDEFREALRVPKLAEAQLVKEARERIKGSTRWVVVTRGAEPALFATAGAAWWAMPPRVKPVNTVGSGDAVAAGMVAALLEQASPEDVIRRAVACGTANTLVSGPGVVRPADVKRLAGEVRLKAVE